MSIIAQAMPRVLRDQSVYTKQDGWLDRSVWRFCMGILLIVVSGLFYIGIHVESVKLGYDINTLEKVKQQLLGDNQVLAVEVALLKGPERLEKIAIETLGLRVPEEKQFVYFNGTAAATVASTESAYGKSPR